MLAGYERTPGCRREVSLREALLPSLIFTARVFHLGIVSGGIKLPDQFREPVRHPLPHHIVVHGAELVADSRLNLGVQAALLARCRIFAGLRLYIFHDLFHPSPRFKSLHFKNYSNRETLLRRQSVGRLIRSQPESSETEGTFMGLGRNQARQGEPGSPHIEYLDPKEWWCGDVPITARCRTFTVVAALCPCADGKPGVGRRICRRHAGSPASGFVPAR